MDASLLTSTAFWEDLASPMHDIPELAGQVLFETSGSTCDPKWVALSKQALLVSAAAVNRHLGVTRDSCWGLALPLNHVGGFGVAARAYAACCRCETFGQRWNPGKFHEWLGGQEVTHTSLVPTQVHDLVKADLAAPAALLAIVVGGGHLDSLTGQAARDLGWPVLASDGMTEAGSQIATQGIEALQALYQPVPIPLLPIWEAEISPGGVLAIAGPALFSGYVSGGNYVARESLWHLTSDRVALNHRTLTPLGRADSVVKILGELVDPEAIERELVLISGGKLTTGTVAVIATPDERAGNALVPVFESTVDPFTIQAVLSHYAGQAPGFRRLKDAVVLGEFPRSGLGKLRRSELAAIYQQFLTAHRAPPA